MVCGPGACRTGRRSRTEKYALIIHESCDKYTCQTGPHTYQSTLNLAFVVAHQLGGCASDGQLAGLLDLGLEENFPAFAPHLSDQGLAGDDGTREADLDVLECAEAMYVFSVCYASCVKRCSLPIVDRLTGEAE